MKYIAFILLVFTLAACAAPTAQATLPSATPASTAASQASSPTLSSATSAAPLSGKVDFKIVAAESQASYTVDETLFNQNNRLNTAVGVTHVVNGDINADLTTPANTTIGPITIDISQFVSDSGQRDRYIQGHFLESSTYPTATFVTQTITGLPASYVDGKSYTFQISGNLTVHAVTKPVTFQVTAKLSGNTLAGEATAQVLMSQFGVGPISLLGILQTQDQVKLTIDFVARP